MTETAQLTIQKPSRRINIDLVSLLFFRPRKAFKEITSQTTSFWTTPLLILSIIAIAHAIVAGVIKQEAALTGQISLPPNFQYYSPEQQAQFQQALTATQSPVFFYILPAFSSFAGVWLRWLLVGGLVHLALTLIGGRGATSSAMNIVAWASLPFAIRYGVRIIYMLVSGQLISHSGLSGFVPNVDDGWGNYWFSFLALIDLYVIWHIFLIGVGVMAADGLTPTKIFTTTALVIFLVLSLQALLSHLITQLGNLTIVRPFF